MRQLKHALLTLARHEQSRECLLLLEAILEAPELMPRLMEVLRPGKTDTEEKADGEKQLERARPVRKGDDCGFVL